MKKIFVLIALAFFVTPSLLYSIPIESQGSASSSTDNTFSAVHSFETLKNSTSTSSSPEEPAPCPNCGGGGGGGGGLPPTVSYSIDILGNAKVQIDSSTYSNGQSVTLYASTTYEIQAVSIESGFKFFQ